MVDLSLYDGAAISTKQRRLQVFSYLDELRYQHIGALHEGECWEGNLTIKLNKSDISISFLLVIDDWDFTSLPKLYLTQPFTTEIKKHFPMPHLDVFESIINNQSCHGFCYALPDRNELPRLNPKEIINYVLFQTQSILEKLIKSSEYRRSELYREIEPMWLSLWHFQKIKSPSNYIELRSAIFKVNNHTDNYYFSLYKNEKTSAPAIIIEFDNYNIQDLKKLLPLSGLNGNWFSFVNG